MTIYSPKMSVYIWPGSRPTAELWPKSAGAAAGRGVWVWHCRLQILQTRGRRGRVRVSRVSCRVPCACVGCWVCGFVFCWCFNEGYRISHAAYAPVSAVPIWAWARCPLASCHLHLPSASASARLPCVVRCAITSVPFSMRAMRMNNMLLCCVGRIPSSVQLAVCVCSLYSMRNIE